MVFAVIGGDMRQVKLAEMLTLDGHTVRASYLENAESRLIKSVPLHESLEGAEYVILPLPASNGEFVATPLSPEKLTLRELTELTAPTATVLAGKLPSKARDALERRGARAIDYFEREELTVKNAAATAEGAIELLMQELPVTLSGTEILVVGFGRIGKLLAMKLLALGAKVTVSARRYADFAWIEALGMRAADTRALGGTLGTYSAVVNTVPAMILPRELLAELGEGCLCLDLASKPGGIDFSAAQELGVRAIWALSLPGRVAPVTSGAAIKEAIYNIISELECAN